MSKIYYLMGKSSTGKDTIYKELRKRMPQLKNVTIYTTRPRREGEKEGEEYFFTDETELEKFKTEGRLIEERAYNTVYGIWNYFTADDGQFNFEQKNDINTKIKNNTYYQENHSANVDNVLRKSNFRGKISLS